MAMQLIETVQLASNATSIDISGIPGDGSHLMILGSARSSDYLGNFRFNSTGNFDYTGLRSVNTSAAQETSTGLSSFGRLYVTDTTYIANGFGNFKLYVTNYATSGYKSFILETVAPNNTSSENAMGVWQGEWLQTSAITSFNMLFDTYQANSTISIYKLTS